MIDNTDTFGFICPMKSFNVIILLLSESQYHFVQKILFVYCSWNTHTHSDVSLRRIVFFINIAD